MALHSSMSKGVVPEGLYQCGSLGTEGQDSLEQGDRTILTGLPILLPRICYAAPPRRRTSGVEPRGALRGLAVVPRLRSGAGCKALQPRGMSPRTWLQPCRTGRSASSLRPMRWYDSDNAITLGLEDPGDPACVAERKRRKQSQA